MDFTLGLILMALVLALLAGAVSGWLIEVFESRPRERALQLEIAALAARLSAAERASTALSSQLRAAGRRAERVIQRLGDRDAALASARIELERREAQVAALHVELDTAAAHRSADEIALRKALADAKARATALNKEREALVHGFEELMQRKNADMGALRAHLAERERKLAQFQRSETRPVHRRQAA